MVPLDRQLRYQSLLVQADRAPVIRSMTLWSEVRRCFGPTRAIGPTIVNAQSKNIEATWLFGMEVAIFVADISKSNMLAAGNVVPQQPKTREWGPSWAVEVCKALVCPIGEVCLVDDESSTDSEEKTRAVDAILQQGR